MSIGSDQAPVALTAIEEPDDVWADMTATEYHTEAADGVITRAAIGNAPNAPALLPNLNFATGRQSVLTLPEGDGGDPPYSYALSNVDTDIMTWDADTRRLAVNPTADASPVVHRMMTYTVTDRHGDSASAEASVRYVDNTMPRITGGFPAFFDFGPTTAILSGISGDSTRVNPISEYEALGLPEGVTTQGSWPGLTGNFVLVGGASAATSGVYRVLERVVDADGDMGRTSTVFNTQISLVGGRPFAGTPPPQHASDQGCCHIRHHHQCGHSRVWQHHIRRRGPARGLDVQFFHAANHRNAHRDGRLRGADRGHRRGPLAARQHCHHRLRHRGRGLAYDPIGAVAVHPLARQSAAQAPQDHP